MTKYTLKQVFSLRVCGVYMIRNNANGKVYVGSSRNVRQRKRDHYVLLRSGKHNNDYLQKTWNKHGEQSFDFVLVAITTEEDQYAAEQRMMDEMDSCNHEKGYNICPSATGHIHSEATKKRMSEWHKGKIVSQETRRKFSQAWTPERRLRAAELVRANPKMRGGPKGRRWRRPEGWGKLHGDKLRGRKLGPRNKPSPMKGKKRTEEDKAKMRAAVTPELRKARSERMKKYHHDRLVAKLTAVAC